MSATVARATAAVPIALRRERFYVRIAVACLAVAVVGFWPTYWLPMWRGTLDVVPITHVHALFFYGWVVLFLTQTSLAASGALPRHRELGVAGVALATGMCFVGLGTALHSLQVSLAAGFGNEARAFSVVPLTGIALFAVLFAIAVLNVKKRDIHKRVMLVATVSLLQAGVGRWFVLFLAPPRPEGLVGPVAPPPVFVTVMPGLVADLLIVVAMIHDRRTRGRVHPAYWIAGGAVVLVQVLRVPLSTTGAWTRITEWLLALAP